MDARTRWLQVTWPTSTTMMELPICLAIMSVMIGVAIYGFARAQERLHVLEAISIMPGPEISMIEYRAVNGTWPDSNQKAGFSSEKMTNGSRFQSVEIREGGAVDIKFSSRAGILADKILSVRAWQGSSAVLPAAWRCGHSVATPLAPTAEDRTTLGDDEVPSPCRSHL